MAAGTDGGTCPRCGAAHEQGQEYCLECGQRLPVPGSVGSELSAAWRRRVGWSPAQWVWPVLLGLLIAALMTGLAILIAHGGDEERPFLVATIENTEVAPPTTVTPPVTATATTATIETAPPQTQPPPRPELVEWPPSQNGYTLVIASIPAGSGRAVAIRKAREVLRSRLPDVGVIDSAEFSSLHPGYYVVFSGIYAAQRDALRAAPRVQNLYPAAYVRQISR